MTVRPRRSVLYMPGSNARALEKAKTIAADALILDLEDAVAPDAKAQARAQVADAVKAGGYGPRELVIRINSLDTPWGAEDLRAAVAARPDAILLPKPASSGDIDRASAAMRQAGAGEAMKLWAMIETPIAILKAGEIASAARHAGSRLSVLVMGTNDLIKETGATLDAERTSALYWLSAALTAARAYGLEILDGVYNNFRDMDGYARECRQGRGLGFDGKTLIHPDQVTLANEVFSPPAAEVEFARKHRYAICRERIVPGVSSIGVLLPPVEGWPPLALSTASITESITGPRRDSVVKQLRTAVREVAEILSTS